MKTKRTSKTRTHSTAALGQPGSTIVNGAPRPSTTANLPLTAFNPALPLDGSLIVADVLRDQFNALSEDTQTRATQASLAAEVTALNAEIATRQTQSQVAAQISAAIAYTANNPMNVQPLYMGISDPPTQWDVQQILDRLNVLIVALYRSP